MRRECRECFPRHWLQRKQLVSDPGMRHGTCVMYVSWCMSGLLTRGGGENVPSISGACATRNFTYLVKGPYPDGSSTAHWPLVVGRRRTQFGGQPSRRYPYMGWWRTYLENICDTFVLFSLSPLSYVIFMYWLPARWAPWLLWWPPTECDVVYSSVWIHGVNSVPIVHQHCCYFVGNKITTISMMHISTTTHIMHMCTYESACVCHHIQTLSVSLALCGGSLVVDSPYTGPVMQSFGVFFVDKLSKLLNKQ